METSLVIATYKRQGALAKALQSVWNNNLLPNEILVIDDDQLPQDFIDQWEQRYSSKGVSFVYHQKDHTINRRGLSESKNLAIELVKNPIIFYIDDDVILGKDYIKEIVGVWESNSGDDDLMAVGGKIENNRNQPWLERKVYNRIFGLVSDHDWDINSAGFQCWNQSAEESQRAYYIHGGVSSYRLDILKKFKFNTFSGGRTGLEDVELALRAKQAGYYFIYNPKAFLYHHHEFTGSENAFLSGKKESQNQKEIFKSLCPQNFWNRILYWRGVFGVFLKKVLTLKLKNAAGILAGLIK